jgi:hypothetical protein
MRLGLKLLVNGGMDKDCLDQSYLQAVEELKTNGPTGTHIETICLLKTKEETGYTTRILYASWKYVFLKDEEADFSQTIPYIRGSL